MKYLPLKAEKKVSSVNFSTIIVHTHTAKVCEPGLQRRNRCGQFSSFGIKLAALDNRLRSQCCCNPLKWGTFNFWMLVPVFLRDRRECQALVDHIWKITGNNE